ncbi:MAG: lytic transglycosylase domain-containing protein [bacterium]|nr:lytic transglycosylase domain-containing protein [bacterium]
MNCKSVLKYSVFLIVAGIILLLAKTLAGPIKCAPIVRKFAQKYNMDPALIMAVIETESKFNAKAVSKAGAIGLMQIMPKTAKSLSRELNIKKYNKNSLYNPEINIRIGTYYLKKLLQEFNNDIDLSLGAYNGGIGNIKKWQKQKKEIPFEETRTFIKKVKSARIKYKVLSKLHSACQYKKLCDNIKN